MQVKIKISRKFPLSENGVVKLIQSLSTVTAVKANDGILYYPSKRIKRFIFELCLYHAPCLYVIKLKKLLLRSFVTNNFAIVYPLIIWWKKKSFVYIVFMVHFKCSKIR